MSKDEPAAVEILRIDAACRQYGDGDNALTILDGADLSVHAGEMVALVAPSGAGKSTLLHLAGLLEKPDAGEVFIAGEAHQQTE